MTLEPITKRLTPKGTDCRKVNSVQLQVCLMPCDALLVSNQTLDSLSIRSHLSEVGLEAVVALAERAIAHKSDKFVDPSAEAGAVEAGWRHTVDLHEAQVGMRLALQAAEQASDRDPGEATWARIVELQQRIARGIERDGSGG